MTKLISIKELRTQFPKIQKELANGESFILLRRSQAIGRLNPIEKSDDARKIFKIFAHPPKHLFFRSKKSAVDLIREERA